MDKPNQRQHYIPQCYLKWFSSDGKSIYTYDKHLSKKYRASMKNVCSEDNIYSLSDEFVSRNNAEPGNSEINRQTIEHDFFSRDVEPLLDLNLRQLDEICEEWMSGKDHYLLNSNEKLELALHLVTLYFRHPLVMESTVDNSIRSEKASLDMIKMMMASTTGDDQYNQLQIDLEYDKPALSAQMTFMSKEFMMDFAHAISKNIFVFWTSKGGDFYTSDFPIAVNPHEDNVRPLYMGLAQYGGEVMFTLSPKVALSVYDRECFKKDDDLDGCFIPADDKEVRRHNMIQYFYAQRQVFSLKNDFSMIDFIYEHNGHQHIYKAPNHRMSIVSGLGKY